MEDRSFDQCGSANTNNTAAFSPSTTLSTTIRMVPFAGVRTITVHFNTLTISGRTVPNNTEITSTQSIQLKEGKSYTMKIQFKKAIGINVPSGSINLTTNGCSSADKTALAKLIWADGNLKSTGSANYVWGLIQNMDIITHGKVHIREIHHSIIPILAQNLKVITERGGVPLQKMKWTSYPDVRIKLL